MGGITSSTVQMNNIEMKAENAMLTFPNLQQVFDIQDKEIQIEKTRQKLREYIISACNYVPVDGIWKGLIKYAFTYVTTDSANNEDPVDKKIERHIGTLLYSQFSAEFGEIKKKLQSIQGFIDTNRFHEAYADMSYCISRCGVLLNLFLSNLNHALSMAVLFKELCLVYIILGLALVEYDTIHKPDIINRCNEIENAVKKFKERAVNERIEMVSSKIYSEGVEYTDQLRDDIRPLSIYMPENVTPKLERLMDERERQVAEYKEQLKILYNNYFDRIKYDALDQAKARFQGIR